MPTEIQDEILNLRELISDAEDWLAIAERTENERAAAEKSIQGWKAEIERLKKHA